MSLLRMSGPALSEQDNEDFGTERDVEELQNDDEADEVMLSGEQHIVQTSPDVNLWSRMSRSGRCSMLEFQFVSELRQDWA